MVNVTFQPRRFAAGIVTGAAIATWMAGGLAPLAAAVFNTNSPPSLSGVEMARAGNSLPAGPERN